MPRVNQEIAKALFESLVERGAPKLFRREPDPWKARKLAQLGFDEGAQRRVARFHATDRGEALGIFNAKSEADIPALVTGEPKGELSSSRPNVQVETVPFPSARMKSFTQEEWDRDITKGGWEWSNDITERLKKQYDFVEFPDVIEGNIDPRTGERFRQVVQLNKNKGLAKFLPGALGPEQTKEIYRILQAAGVAAPSIGMFQPETGTGE